MTSRERVLCALAGGKPDRVPFAESNIDDNIARALLGRSSTALVSQKELSARMGRDIVFLPCNPPFFVDWQYASQDGSAAMTPQIHDEDDLAKIVFPAIDRQMVSEFREFIATQRGERAAVAGTRLGLSATIASMGTAEFCVAMVERPAFVQEVLRRYGDWVKRLVVVFEEVGFDVVWVFDDFAYQSGPLFSPAMFRELILPVLRPQAEAIVLPWIFHSDGNLMPVIEDLLTLGMSGIHPIQPECMSLAETKHVLGGRACTVGNVSVDVLARGTEQQTRKAVRDALAAGAPDGAYMISSSNSIPSYARLENVAAMIDEIQRSNSELGTPT